MPTYEYVCTACGNNLEVVQRFTDESLTECPACHGRLRKMFYPVGVVFKGSGFYRTDSRTQDKEPAAAGSTNGSAGTKADDAVKTVEKTGGGDGAKTGSGRKGGDGAKTGSGRKGESGAKKAASTPAA